MRMWMVDPRIMCRQHLIGEYRELFTITGILKKKIKIDGYIRNNLIELSSLQSRYQELKEEMLNRSYKPVKPFLIPEDLSYLEKSILEYKIDRPPALADLLNRCSVCRERHLHYYEQ